MRSNTEAPCVWGVQSSSKQTAASKHPPGAAARSESQVSINLIGSRARSAADQTGPSRYSATKHTHTQQEARGTKQDTTGRKPLPSCCHGNTNQDTGRQASLGRTRGMGWEGHAEEGSWWKLPSKPNCTWNTSSVKFYWQAPGWRATSTPSRTGWEVGGLKADTQRS